MSNLRKEIRMEPFDSHMVKTAVAKIKKRSDGILRAAMEKAVMSSAPLKKMKLKSRSRPKTKKAKVAKMPARIYVEFDETGIIAGAVTELNEVTSGARIGVYVIDGAGIACTETLLKPIPEETNE